MKKLETALKTLHEHWVGNKLSLSDFNALTAQVACIAMESVLHGHPLAATNDSQVALVVLMTVPGIVLRSGSKSGRFVFMPDRLFESEREEHDKQDAVEQAIRIAHCMAAVLGKAEEK